MMNPEIKARWIERLRSGDYKQGTGYLKLVDDGGNFSYCCLGVLCEIAVEDRILAPSMATDSIHRYVAAADEDDYNETVLPRAVAKWAGIDTDGVQVDWIHRNCPDVDEYGHWGMLCGNCRQLELPTINDENVPFNEIADIIEKWF